METPPPSPTAHVRRTLHRALHSDTSTASLRSASEARKSNQGEPHFLALPCLFAPICRKRRNDRDASGKASRRQRRRRQYARQQSTNLKVLAALQRLLHLVFALLALHAQRHLLCRLCLLLEDWLGLATVALRTKRTRRTYLCRGGGGRWTQQKRSTMKQQPATTKKGKHIRQEDSEEKRTRWGNMHSRALGAYQ